MKTPCFATLLAFACIGCNKSVDNLPEPALEKNMSQEPAAFKGILYTIKKGTHSCDKSTLKRVETTALAFSVRFDSSAVYRSVKAENQYDINKLYGFSDNNSQHHLFSARFGWRWSDDALRLFAYVYNNGQRIEKELGVVPIGAWVDCSIKVTETQYLFTLNDLEYVMPRASGTVNASGYMLFPYFGGDETAPHDVRIEIKDL